MRFRSRIVANLFVLMLLSAAGRASAHAAEMERALPSLGSYVSLGVEHIVLGFDHLVFLLGVVLIASRTRSVLMAVTAFTLAHSVTLACSVLGVVSVSPRLVEPLIAISVAYVGIENFWLRDGAQRYRLTFAFGLVHGFGFAGALQEIGVPEGHAGPALALFNLGVELGQLAVLAAVWPLLTWLRRSREHTFERLVRVVNVALVLLGTGWAIERTLGGEPAVATDAPRAMAPAVVPTSPLAQTLCHAFQRLPRERRAACGGGPVGVTLEADCTRALSLSLSSEAVRIDASAAASCVAATQARYRECDFAREIVLPPLAVCESLWQGQLEAGASCRSSLECRPGLHCHGAGAFEPGTCGAPKASGESCGRGSDVLAAYVPDRTADHPECAGRCGQQRCQ